MSKEEHELRYKATVDTKGFKSGMDDIEKDAKGAADTVGGEFTESTDKATKGFDALGLAGKTALISTIVAGGMKAAATMKELADEAGNAEVAMRALNSTAKAYGQNTIKANEYVKKLREDGLMSLEQSTRTLQNLMGAGFNIDQAFDIASSMKDIGAFNNIIGDLGEAMVDSSKGIKTNSVELMENIGLTIRLGNLVDGQIDLVNSAEQRQAVYNAILADGNKFTGDAARLTDSYNGKLAKMNTSWQEYKVTLGEGVKPQLEETYSWLDKIFKKMTQIEKTRQRDNELMAEAQEIQKMYERSGMDPNDAYQLAIKKAEELVRRRKEKGSSMTTAEEQNSLQDYAEGSLKPDFTNGSSQLNSVGTSGNNTPFTSPTPTNYKLDNINPAYTYAPNTNGWSEGEQQPSLGNFKLGESTGLDEAAISEYVEDMERVAEEEARVQDLRKTQEEDFNNEMTSIKESGMAVMANVASQVLSGEIKSISDLGKVLTQKLGVLMLSEAEEAAVRGGVDWMKGTSYAADIVTAPLAPPLFAAAKQEFAFAAKMGAAGAALTAVSSGSSSDISSERDSQQADKDTDNLSDIADENNKKTTVYVDSEELWETIYHSTKQYAEDSDMEYIVRKG